MDDDFDSDEDDLPDGGHMDDDEAGQSEVDRPPAVSYDTTLPAQHSYLGSNGFQIEEVSGRVFLDDNSLVKIPLLTIPNLVLVPGQILPLQLEHPSLVAMMRKVIEKERIFGMTSSNQVNAIGTTAEIRSFGEEETAHLQGLTTLRIKAEGRQIFRVKETWREINGILMGRVLICEDIQLTNPLRRVCELHSKLTPVNGKLLSAGTRFPQFVYQMYDAETLMTRVKSHLKNWATTVKAKPLIKETRTREATGQLEGGGLVRTTRRIVTTIRARNRGEDDDDNANSPPNKPSEFSYWVAANLPLEDSHRLELLGLACPIQRLRWESSILQKYLYLCCVQCRAKVCQREDIFSMSVQGPLGTYVNPFGHVSETLTAYKAESLTLRGQASEEFSWFPGYAWTVCACSQCGNHMGWQFTATTKKLRPEAFWGICRASISPGLDLDSSQTWKPVI